MDLKQPIIKLELSANALPSVIRGQQTRRVKLGRPRNIAFPGFDILYSVRVTADSGIDAFNLSLSQGSIVKGPGTPDVTRWTGGTNDVDGKDFESVALPVAVNLGGVLIETPVANTSDITIASSDNGMIDVPVAKPGFFALVGYRGGKPVLGTINFTFGSVGDIVDLAVLAKSS